MDEIPALYPEITEQQARLLAKEFFNEMQTKKLGGSKQTARVNPPSDKLTSGYIVVPTIPASIRKFFPGLYNQDI